jgi:hypothetical protein
VPEDKQTSRHYVFAHIALRQVCCVNPIAFFAVMASPQRVQFLDDVWKDVREICDKDGEPSFSSRDIVVELDQVNDFPAILIVMPAPKVDCEAHMVCIVLEIPVKELSQKRDQIPSIRYFTLEKGIRIETGGERTVLCAWDGEAHLNYGDGPEATQEAFLEAVKRLI